MEGYDQFSIGFLPRFKKGNIDFTIIYSVFQNHHILFFYSMLMISIFLSREWAQKHLQTFHIISLHIMRYEAQDQSRTIHIICSQNLIWWLTAQEPIFSYLGISVTFEAFYASVTDTTVISLYFLSWWFKSCVIHQ